LSFYLYSCVRRKYKKKKDKPTKLLRCGSYKGGMQTEANGDVALGLDSEIYCGAREEIYKQNS